ncbi:MAG: hypothetical protein Q7T82_19030, partial [Armatimonadota bacterium]|nr:hypothetical protein [Armatimonadota bacterium]
LVSLHYTEFQLTKGGVEPPHSKAGPRKKVELSLTIIVTCTRSAQLLPPAPRIAIMRTACFLRRVT